MHALSTDERAPCAADAAWLAENSRGLAAAATGHWTEAVEAFATAAELATGDDASPHDALALVLNNLAQASFRAGQHDDGIRHAQRVCALRTALAGEDAITVARARADLAVMLGTVGRSEEGRALAARAAAGIERTAGDEDVRLCSVLENAARLALAAGQLSSAEPLLLRLHALLAVHELPTTPADALLAHIARHRQASTAPRVDPAPEAVAPSVDVSAPPVVVETIEAPPVVEAALESLVAEAVVAEAVVAEPMVVDSLVVEPMVVEPMVAEPIVAEPIVVEPIVVEPIIVEQVTVVEQVLETSVVVEPVVDELDIVEAVVDELLVMEARVDDAGSVANIAFDLADDFDGRPALQLDETTVVEPAAVPVADTVGALAFADVLDLEDGRADDILGNVTFDLIELEPPAAPGRAGSAVDTPVEAPVLDVLGFTVEYGTPTELDYTSSSDAIIAPPPSRHIATPASGSDARLLDSHGRVSHGAATSPAASSHEAPRGATGQASVAPSTTTHGGAAPAPYLTLHQSDDEHRDRRGKLRAGRASAPQSSGGVMIAGAVTAAVAAGLAWLTFAGG